MIRNTRMAAALFATLAVAGCQPKPAQQVPTLPETNAAANQKLTPASNEALRRELLRLAQDEEAARTALAQTATPDPGLILNRRDQITAYSARVDAIVSQHGWPGKTLVGDDGARAAWALAQYATENPAFQKRCLEAMQKAPKGEVLGLFLAYLEDRVRVNDGRKQWYGTLLVVVNGHVKALPIEDEKNVDARRKEVGLEPLAHFIAYEQVAYNNRVRAQRRQGGAGPR